MLSMLMILHSSVRAHCCVSVHPGSEGAGHRGPVLTRAESEGEGEWLFPSPWHLGNGIWWMASRGGLLNKGEIHMPVRVQWRDTKMVRGWKMWWSRRGWKLGLFCSKKKMTLGGSHHCLQLPRGACRKDGTRLSSRVLDDRTTSSGHSWHQMNPH